MGNCRVGRATHSELFISKTVYELSLQIEVYQIRTFCTHMFIPIYGHQE